MHPTTMLIEALVYKKLPPGYSPIGIQAFLTHHVYFGPEVKVTWGLMYNNGLPDADSAGAMANPLEPVCISSALLATSATAVLLSPV